MGEETTTITIRVSTRDRIKALGMMGDDYDAVLSRLLDEHNHKVRKPTVK